MPDVNTPVWNTCMRHVSRSSFAPSPFLSTFHSVSHSLPTLSSSSLSISLPFYFIHPLVCQYYPRTTLAVSTFVRVRREKWVGIFLPIWKKYRETIEFFRYRQKEFLFTAHKFLSDIYRLRTASRPSSAMDDENKTRYAETFTFRVSMLPKAKKYMLM